MKTLKSRSFWVSLALLISLIAFVLYGAIQQSLRLAADQPQTSMAVDAARDVAGGRNPQEITPGYVDMSQSAAPFLIIYDQYGKVVSGNGYLDNSIPQVPIGVLSAAQNDKTHNVTWEPKNGIRVASASARAGDYYVLGGRSLTQTEKWTSNAFKLLGILWLLGLAIIFVGYRITNTKKTQDKKDL